jgi:hypothetical protein
MPKTSPNSPTFPLFFFFLGTSTACTFVELKQYAKDNFKAVEDRPIACTGDWQRVDQEAGKKGWIVFRDIWSALGFPAILCVPSAPAIVRPGDHPKAFVVESI